MKKFAFILFVLAACAGKEKEKTLLPPSEFQQKLATTPEGVLLDVRTQHEFQSGFLKGSVNIDFNSPEFKLLVSGMDKNKTYFVYCGSGVRSAKAAEQMEDLKFSKVYTLDGGIKAWQAAGLPVHGGTSGQ